MDSRPEDEGLRRAHKEALLDCFLEDSVDAASAVYQKVPPTPPHPCSLEGTAPRQESQRHRPTHTAEGARQAGAPARVCAYSRTGAEGAPGAQTRRQARTRAGAHTRTRLRAQAATGADRRVRAGFGKRRGAPTARARSSAGRVRPPGKRLTLRLFPFLG